MAEPNTMSILQGVRDSINVDTNAILKRDVQSGVTLLEADRTKLLIMLNKTRKGGAMNPKIEWIEDEYVAEGVTINNSGGYNTIQTDLTLDSSDPLVVGDVLRDSRTGEHMRVTANDTATDIITVIRNVTAGTPGTGTAINDGDTLVSLGNVNQEGATLRTIVSTVADAPYNYTQIIRDPIGLTETEMRTDTYYGKDMPWQRQKKLVEHHQHIEKLIYFGKRKLDTSGTHPMRYMGGIHQILSTNVTADGSGALTETEWSTFMRDIFRQGSSTKWCVTSNIYVDGINQWANNKLRVNMAAKKYGMRVWEWFNAFGDALLFSSEILTRTPVWSGYAFILDPAKLRLRYLRNTVLKKNRQDNSEDSQKEEYLSEVSLERKHEAAHGVMTGVTSITP